MKVLIHYLAIVLIAFGCQQGDAVQPTSGSLPLGIGIAFQIIDSDTGKDWFIGNDKYDPNQVKVYFREAKEEYAQDTVFLKQQDSSTTFMFAKTINFEQDSTEYIVELAPSDYDTVSIYIQSKFTPEAGYRGWYTTLEMLRVYYNGSLVSERNLIGDSTLLQRTIGGEEVDIFYKQKIEK